MKKIIKLFAVLILLYSSIFIVSADGQYLYDYANLMTTQERNNVENRLQNLSNKYNANFVILTVGDYSGYSLESYADDFYDRYYRGDGIIFAISIETEEWYMSPVGSLRYAVDDYDIDNIFNNISQYLYYGQWESAFTTYLSLVEKEIISYNNGGGNERQFGLSNVAMSLILGVIVATIITSIFVKQMRNVRRQRFAGNYIVNNSFVLTGCADMFVNRQVTRTKIRRNDNPHSSPGTNLSSHVSSGHVVHGGHGGSFKH